MGQASDYPIFGFVVLGACILCGLYLIYGLGQAAKEFEARLHQRDQIVYILETWEHEALTTTNLEALSDVELDHLIFALSRADSNEVFEEAIRYHIH